MRPKYAVEVQQRMPNFDIESQEDISKLQQGAQLLLNRLQENKPQALGLPPSLLGEINWPTMKVQIGQLNKGNKGKKEFIEKSYVPSAYLKAKQVRQGNKTHVNLTERVEVEERLEAIQESNDATNVRLFLYIDGTLELEARKDIPEPPQQGNPFYRPFSQTSQEITSSEHDTETRLLTSALATCRLNSQITQFDEEGHVYELALVGPHGPCDGCKDRLRAFKVQWKQLFQGAPGSRRLVITYFYTQKKSLQRSETSVYGWDEALEKKLNPKQKDSPTYYYRSLNTEVVPQV